MNLAIAVWIEAISAFVSLIVAFSALNTARSNKTIKLALAEFKEELQKDRLLLNQEVIDYRFKGEDDKIRSLDHRTTRNTEHLSMILSVLLKAGALDAAKIHAMSGD
jgi:hypothetical protein